MESDIGFTVRKKMNVDDLYMDRDSQVAAIEKTFEDALKPITTHYSKPHIHPVEVMPVLPDSNMWKYPCAQVTLLTLHPSPQPLTRRTLLQNYACMKDWYRPVASQYAWLNFMQLSAASRERHRSVAPLLALKCTFWPGSNTF